MVAGAAGTLSNAMGQSAAAAKQQRDYEAWAAQQHANRVAANIKDEQDRQQAEAARQQGLQQLSPDNQAATQKAEQDRLTKYLQGDPNQPASTTSTPGATAPSTPTSVTDDIMARNSNVTDPYLKSDLATKLNAASAAAKARIAALAGVSSYGGSSGGLDQLTSRALQTSGQGIDLANEFRKGDLGVLATEQAVNPIQTTYQPSPFASMAGSLLQTGAQGVGQALSKAGGLSNITKAFGFTG